MKLLKIMGLILFTGVLVSGAKLEWVKQFNASGDYRDCSYGIAVDKNGYVYVTGQGYGEGTQCDFTTIKYSPEGEVVWKQVYNSPENGYDKPYAITVDDLGYVYITGCGWGGEESFEDIVTIKYSPEGREVWRQVYDGPARDFDCPYAIAVDKNYNVYVTGESYGGEETFEDIVTIKYSPEGKEVWVKRYDGEDHDYEYPTSLVVDDSFNVYVTGLCFNLDTDEDFVTIKYSQPEELERYREKMKPMELTTQEDTAEIVEEGESTGRCGAFAFYKK